jgi:cytochrome c biogenesis factor
MNMDSNSEIAALRNQVFTLLVALIVVSGTVTVYLYRQTSVTGKDLSASEQLVNNYTKGQPAVVTFINQLGAYSMTHTEVRPVLAKYGIVPAPTQPNLGAPAAAVPAVPKK